MVGVSSGANYQSADTRGLDSIVQTRYPTNDPNFSQTIGDLKDNVKYLAGYMQSMQQGIDQNNTDVADDIGNLITGLLGLLTGQTQQGPIDWGDFGYYFTALGAMFGWNGNPDYPINAADAAQEFFLGYIVPQDAWETALQDNFKKQLNQLGFSDTAINDLLEMQAAFNGPGAVIQNDIQQFFTSVQKMLSIFGINQATDDQLQIMWTKLSKLFGGLDSDQVTNIQQFIDNLTIEVSTGVTKALNWLTDMLQVGSDDANVQAFLNFGNMFDDINWNKTPFDSSATWNQIVSNYITQAEAFNAQVLDNVDSTFAQILNYMGFPAIPGKGVEQFGGIVTTLKNYISGVFNKSSIPDVSIDMSQDMQHIVDQIFGSQNPFSDAGQTIESISEALTNIAQSSVQNLETEVQKISLMFTTPNLVLDPTFDNAVLWTGSIGTQSTSKAHSGTNSWQLIGIG